MITIQNVYITVNIQLDTEEPAAPQLVAEVEQEVRKAVEAVAEAKQVEVNNFSGQPVTVSEVREELQIDIGEPKPPRQWTPREPKTDEPVFIQDDLPAQEMVVKKLKPSEGLEVAKDQPPTRGKRGPAPWPVCVQCKAKKPPTQMDAKGVCARCNEL